MMVINRIIVHLAIVSRGVIILMIRDLRRSSMRLIIQIPRVGVLLIAHNLLALLFLQFQLPEMHLPFLLCISIWHGPVHALRVELRTDATVATASLGVGASAKVLWVGIVVDVVTATTMLDGTRRVVRLATGVRANA